MCGWRRHFKINILLLITQKNKIPFPLLKEKKKQPINSMLVLESQHPFFNTSGNGATFTFDLQPDVEQYLY